MALGNDATKNVGHGHNRPLVSVTVNHDAVEILGPKASGKQIKVAAIEQGAKLELDFPLEIHLPDGTEKEVEDHEHIGLDSGMVFSAHKGELTIFVNEQPVLVKKRHEDGLQIKAAAISQGVLIQPNFILQEELANGTSRIVGDADRIKLREHLRFTAIAPDDNS